jgi:hypothetical protein
MKAIYGLAIAAALGLSGAMLNLLYLAKLSEQVDLVWFIGIKRDVVLARGETLQDEHMEAVPIPLQWVGKMRDYVELWQSREACRGRPVSRTVIGPCLLLSSDLKTPPPEMELKLADDERAWGIPIDTRQFPVSLINPGDLVSFLVPRSGGLVPTRAGAQGAGEEPAGEDGQDPTPRAAPSAVEIVGPFKVLSLGNRLGTAEVMRAHRIPVSQENVLTIAVKIEKGQPEAKAQKLFTLLHAADFRGVGVQLHPRPKTAQ